MKENLLSWEELRSLGIGRPKDSWYVYQHQDEYEYLGTVQEAWGDRSYYRHLETGEIVSTYFSIGD